MMRKRLSLLFVVSLLVEVAMLLTQRPASGKTVATLPGISGLPYTPVVTPNGSTLPWTMENGVKVFHLTV